MMFSSDETPLHRLMSGTECACSNVHNVEAVKGRAGAKSRFPRLEPGQGVTVADLEGPAVITRFWLTFDWPGKHAYDQSTMRNRAIYLEITWDNASRPAISVPVGDFFCHPLCYDMPFENALFAAPVGRSLMCYIPMPFRERAHIRIVNEFDRPVTVFHDIRFVRGGELDQDDAYLHACFKRTIPTEPGITHDILPKVQGRGRYLGTHVGFITDHFNPLHWHGAQPALYFDGDEEWPSILGASMDDFGGASWAFDRPFINQDSGLMLSRNFALGGGHYGYYFYHRRDPLYFQESCAVSIRPAITMSAERIVSLLKEHPGIAGRMAMPDFTVSELEQHVREGRDDWYECGRMDDLSSVALYYLDRPEGDHTIPAKDTRCAEAWCWPAQDAAVLLGD